MVICATRVRWKDLSAILALTAAFALCLVGGQPQYATAASTTVTSDIEDELASYLSELGWEVSGEPVTDQVLLPDDFSSEYDSYLAIQAQGGFDLAAYAGETVIRYSFPIGNYPTGESGVMADLLVWNGTIVGGDLRSSQLDGFMTALTALDSADESRSA